MYLSQFDLDVRHKSGRDLVIPDALSRLPSFDKDENDESSKDILNNIDAYAGNEKSRSGSHSLTGSSGRNGYRVCVRERRDIVV